MEEKKEARKDNGAIWIRKSKAGAEYFSMLIDGKNYVAFKNNKQKDNQPDYKIFESDSKPQEAKTDTPAEAKADSFEVSKDEKLPF